MVFVKYDVMFIYWNGLVLGLAFIASLPSFPSVVLLGLVPCSFIAFVGLGLVVGALVVCC